MGGVCYLSMGMVVLLMGLVFASVYIYRYFFLAQVRSQAGGWGKGGNSGELGHGDPTKRDSRQPLAQA